MKHPYLPNSLIMPFFLLPQAMIRLVCSDRDAAVKLDFAREFTDRDAVRDVLNRIQTQGAQHPASLASMQGGGSAAGRAKASRGSLQCPSTRTNVGGGRKS